MFTQFISLFCERWKLSSVEGVSNHVCVYLDVRYIFSYILFFFTGNNHEGSRWFDLRFWWRQRRRWVQSPGGRRWVLGSYLLLISRVGFAVLSECIVISHDSLQVAQHSFLLTSESSIHINHWLLIHWRCLLLVFFQPQQTEALAIFHSLTQPHSNQHSTYHWAADFCLCVCVPTTHIHTAYTSYLAHSPR